MSVWLMIFLRSIILFFGAFIFIRAMGKRRIAEMSEFQFVNYTVIAVITTLTALNIVPNFGLGLIALGVWVFFPIFLQFLALKSQWVYRLIHGKETVLIKHGQIMEDNLARMRLTGGELLRELRAKNVFNLSDVEFAVMETSGNINVLLKGDHQPLTPHDAEMAVAPWSEPETVIADGNILDEPLGKRGLNREWLNLELEKLGVTLANVFIGQIDSDGELYIDLFDDTLQIPKPKVKERLYANLMKIQADIMTFALETQDPETKAMYSKHTIKLDQLLKKIRPYLLH